MKIKYLTYLFALSALSITGCKKFLDEKPKNTLQIPTTLKDLQAILDNYSSINYVDGSSSEAVSDDFYLTDADLSSRSELERRLYLWETSNVYSTSGNDWLYLYSNVFKANTVIENLEGAKKTAASPEAFNNVAGQAYYLRAKCFLQLAYSFCLAYDEATKNEDPGIPLRLKTDFNEVSKRANLADTYSQILNDLKMAAQRLPEKPVHVMRPSKPAAYALLARTYWSMRDYKEAKMYADSCLSLKNDLIDYNTLNPAPAYPLQPYNIEIIAYGLSTNTPTTLANTRAKVVPGLIEKYAPGDLRKNLYFKNNGNGTYGFKGGYAEGGALFTGIATDEVYLIRAECLVRLGAVADGLTDLNLLMKKRWDKNVVFNPYKTETDQEALNHILDERRKELLFRGLRWIDIKRLNKEQKNISLTRVYSGKTYLLPAGSKRFANPLPEDVIAITGMPQNLY